MDRFKELDAYVEWCKDHCTNALYKGIKLAVENYKKAANSCALDETQAVRQNEDAESNFICYHFESGNISAKCHKPCGDRCCLAV